MKDHTKPGKRKGKTGYRTPSGFIHRKHIQIVKTKKRLLGLSKNKIQ